MTVWRASRCPTGRPWHLYCIVFILATLGIAACSKPSPATDHTRLNVQLATFTKSIDTDINEIRAVDTSLPASISQAQSTPTVDVDRVFAGDLDTLATISQHWRSITPPPALSKVFATMKDEVSALDTALTGTSHLIDGSIALNPGEVAVITLTGFPAQFTKSLMQLNAISNPSEGRPAPLGPIVTFASATISPAPSPPSTVTSLNSTPPSVVLTSARSSLKAYVARYGQDYQTSGPIDTPAGLLAAVSDEATEYGPGRVDILHYEPTGWALLKSLGAADDLGQAYVGANTTVSAVHLTTSLLPDFFVLLGDGDHESGVVAMFSQGAWELVPFVDAKGTSSVEVINPTIDLARRVVHQSVDNCVPDCASGTNYETTFGYSPSQRAFIPAT